ncbi:MAG: hypothetical protein Q9220_003218 [cf. Caloplaca sp. 1 TL-2023]
MFENLYEFLKINFRGDDMDDLESNFRIVIWESWIAHCLLLLGSQMQKISGFEVANGRVGEGNVRDDLFHNMETLMIKACQWHQDLRELEALNNFDYGIYDEFEWGTQNDMQVKWKVLLRREKKIRDKMISDALGERYASGLEEYFDGSIIQLELLSASMED